MRKTSEQFHEAVDASIAVSEAEDEVRTELFTEARISLDAIELFVRKFGDPAFRSAAQSLINAKVMEES